MYKYQWRGIALMLSVVLLLIGFTTTNAKYVENKEISVNLRVGTYCGEVLKFLVEEKTYKYEDGEDTVHLAYRDQGKITTLMHWQDTDYGGVIHSTGGNAIISYADDSKNTYFGGLMRLTATAENPSITFDCSKWCVNGTRTGINTAKTRYMLIGYYCPKTAGEDISCFNSLKIYFSTREVYHVPEESDIPKHDMSQPFGEGCKAYLAPSFTENENSRWVFAVVDLHELLGADQDLRWVRMDLGVTDHEEQNEKTFYLASLRFFSSYTSAVTVANILEEKYNNYTEALQRPEDYVQKYIKEQPVVKWDGSSNGTSTSFVYVDYKPRAAQ